MSFSGGGGSGTHPELLETKSIAVCVLLSFITFGIYYLYWFYTFCKKIKLLNGEPPSGAGEFFLWLFVPFYSCYWMYTRGKKLYEAARRRGIAITDNSVASLLLTLFAMGIFAFALTQSSLNAVARALSGDMSQ
jgi:hypothetical protein